VREDYQEALDGMFPEGYLIIYTCPDGQLRMALHNPRQYELVDRYHEVLRRESEDA